MQFDKLHKISFMSNAISTKYLSLFILSVAYLLNTESYDGEILHADAWRPCTGHLLGFMSKGIVVTKNDIFKKIPARRPTASQRWRVGRLTGWLQPGRPWLRPVLLIALRSRWLAACRAVTVTWQACRNLIGPCVLSNAKKPLNQAAAAQRAATACAP